MASSETTEPRSIAIIGPYLAGKTTLLENILYVTGAISRKGKIAESNTVGDSSQEARDRQMGVELNLAKAEYLGDTLFFLDCPGSVELAQESFDALTGVDAAVIVAEADVSKSVSLTPLFRFLEAHNIPRIIFVNKLDKGAENLDAFLESLQGVSIPPVVLRHIPIRDGEELTGYVDLASGRAYAYKEEEASETIALPSEIEDEQGTARYDMLEKLADFDDDLMEKLLEDEEPGPDQVYSDLTQSFRDGEIVPVLLGAAEHEHGVRRLLKFLRHEVPAPSQAAARVELGDEEGPVVQVLKTFQTPTFGKLSIARIWRGNVEDGVSFNGERASGLFHMQGQATSKISKATAGEVIAIGRLDEAKTGVTLSTGKETDQLESAPVAFPVYALTIRPKNREDEVKLSGALAKILDEDRSLTVEHSQETNQTILRGQGEIHLRIAVERMKNRYKLELETGQPEIPYKESIRKSISQHARFKRQSGGHGQFGDVEVDIKPLPRGSGFSFDNSIVGGSVPKQYIPAVEAGVLEFLVKGPLGFPVVDLAVSLTDGSYHDVDSSEMAFKTAGRMAMSEGMPKCGPVLLEPILEVRIAVPSEHTARVNALVSGRRGQILGFEAREGWMGWDEVSAHMPHIEVHDLIVELRSLSAGAGNYVWKFDHLQELTGRLADDVVETRKAALENA